MQADPSAMHQVTALDIIKAATGTADEYDLVFPIPQYDLNNNGLIDQNPGYQQKIVSLAQSKPPCFGFAFLYVLPIK